MSRDDASNRRGILVDLSPLRESPAFARLWIGGAITGIGGQMTIVAVGLQVYDLTASTFAVSLVGVIALIPMICFGLYGGMLADAFDRRTVALTAAVVTWTSTAVIAVLAWSGSEVVWPLYLLTTVNAVSTTVVGTTRQAILPRLLPSRLLPSAAALSGISVGVMVTVGPALAGVLVATVGFRWTYTIDVILFAAAFLGIASLPKILPEGGVSRLPGLRSLADGWTFLRTAPNIRMTFIVDIIAMTFGNPRVLYPAVATLLLGGGAITVGVLTAAGAVGALLSSLVSGPIGRIDRQGLAIERAIVVYGVAIAAFGGVLAWVSLTGTATHETDRANLPAIGFAALALAVAGAADNVSAIFRMTMLQAAVPDAVRGRLQGLFTVVVAGGPRVGDLYIGLAASALALWVPPLAGGLLVAAIVAVLVRMQGAFRRYDAKTPTP
ncbi:MAG TPA: MFS transporter [Plantibacter sp.]|uniref:MFS transporter n=1 Tax=unclassified Plantibacter TaxID=2624265 RepID=UPI002C8D4EBB|nr:MFS transporter [Plantibacter sp.]